MGEDLPIFVPGGKGGKIGEKLTKDQEESQNQKNGKRTKETIKVEEGCVRRKEVSVNDLENGVKLKGSKIWLLASKKNYNF